MIKRLIHKPSSNFFSFLEMLEWNISLLSLLFFSFFYYHHEPTLIVFISINCDSFHDISPRHRVTSFIIPAKLDVFFPSRKKLSDPFNVSFTTWSCFYYRPRSAVYGTIERNFIPHSSESHRDSIYIYIYNIFHISNIHSAETKALVRKNKSKFVREYIVRQAWTNMI